MNRPPSRLKQAARESQLIVSVGAASLAAHVLLGSELATHLALPAFSSAALRWIASAFLARAGLLIAAPLLSFGAARIVETHPWRLGVGGVLVAEAGLDLLQWVGGGFDGGNGFLALRLAVSAFAAVASGYAARRPIDPAGVPAPAPSLAEQMRAIQERAQQQASPPDDSA